MKRVPPSKATETRIEELPGNGVSEGSPLSELVRLSVAHIVEEALEAYDRGPSGGYRKGYRQVRLKTRGRCHGLI